MLPIISCKSSFSTDHILQIYPFSFSKVSMKTHFFEQKYKNSTLTCDTSLNNLSLGKCFKANSRWQVYLGSVLRNTAWPYPGTTCPDFKRPHTYSLSCSSVESSPISFTTFDKKTKTSWLAKPWRGPAKPHIPAENDKYGSDKAEPTK